MSSKPPAQWIADHIKLYLEDPEKAHDWDSTVAGGPGLLPTLLLVMKGRKTGETLKLPLIYKKIDGSYVIIASKGGAPKHPLWYLNLQSTPEAHIHVGKEELDVVARTAGGEERERLWDALAELYPPYDDYKTRAAPREIPVVVLDPA